MDLPVGVTGLYCEHCGQATGFVYEFDLNGSRIYCSEVCARDGEAAHEAALLRRFGKYPECP